MKSKLIAASLMVLLAACTSSEPVQDARIAAPDSWTHLASSDSVEIEQSWWKNFNDPVLDRLIGRAMANNKNLQIAAARVAEAEAGLSGSKANLLPDITGGGDVTRGNQGYLTNNQSVTVKEGSLQASWELDLFGKNQARVRQAGALAQSAEAQRQAVLVTLLADVARAYFDIRNNQEQIRITKANLETQRKTLDLIMAQRAGALSSRLDVARSTAQVATTSAQLPSLQAAYETGLDRLNLLLGEKPGTLDAVLAKPEGLPAIEPSVLVAAPAKVLANRPDVRAAERQYAASLSARESAAKEIFPTISLAGLFGIQDSSYLYARPWSGAAQLTTPIFDFGRIEADIDAADARQKQAFLGYQQSVLEAAADMEDALSLYLHDKARQHDLSVAAEENRTAVDLANQQYRAGYSGLLDLLVAQQSELDAESSLATSEAQLRKDLVHIYAAAGGGWAL
jgi:NodT family efflux transporter outer membrane factor (OMF) lipoprotein